MTNVILALTYQLRGQKTTGTPQLFLVTTPKISLAIPRAHTEKYGWLARLGFRLHQARVRVQALICYALLRIDTALSTVGGAAELCMRGTRTILTRIVYRVYCDEELRVHHGW